MASRTPLSARTTPRGLGRASLRAQGRGRRDRSAGTVPPEFPARVGRAIELYEAFEERRPHGWPTSGAAALCRLAAQGRADVFAGDGGRLVLLAKGMHALALVDDPQRVAHARARAVARRAPIGSRLSFRVPPRAEAAEARRLRVRDAVLLLDRDRPPGRTPASRSTTFRSPR